MIDQAVARELAESDTQGLCRYAQGNRGGRDVGLQCDAGARQFARKGTARPDKIMPIPFLLSFWVQSFNRE